MKGTSTPAPSSAHRTRRGFWDRPAAAVGYVVLAGGRSGSRDLVLGVAFVWAVVAVLSLTVPTLVTGADPTRIPLAVLIAPPFGTVITGFLAIAHARASSPDP